MSDALGILPANSSISPDTTFREDFRFIILPAVTVSLTSLGYVTRMTRASTIDVLDNDYVRAADLKGLHRGRVLSHHVLRNSLLPTTMQYTKPAAPGVQSAARPLLPTFSSLMSPGSGMP